MRPEPRTLHGVRARTLTLAVLVACSPAASGSGEGGAVSEATGCGDATCTSGLRIALVSLVFTPGAYTVSTVADELESVCGFVVGGSEDGCGIEAPCLLDDDCDADVNLSFPPHSVVVTVGRGAPEVVDVVILRGGQELVATTLAPAYQTYEPAGVGCDPLCEVASAQLDLP
jgi:hypothetical protein